MSDTAQRMRQVLLRLEMVGHGATQAWNASGGHSGEPDDRMVAQIVRGEQPPHLIYARRWQTAKTESSRLTILTEAEAELTSWIKRQSPAVATKSDSEIMLEDGAGHSAETAARRFGVHQAFIRRLRAKNDRDPETGLPWGSERAELASELSRSGLSQAQIAKRLGVSQQSVSRLIQRHRFRRQQGYSYSEGGSRAS